MVTTRYCGGLSKGFAVAMAGEYEEINHTKRQDKNSYKVAYRNHPGKNFIGASNYQRDRHVGSFMNAPIWSCKYGDRNYLRELTRAATKQDLTRGNFQMVDHGDYPHAIRITAISAGKGTELLNCYGTLAHTPYTSITCDLNKFSFSTLFIFLYHCYLNIATTIKIEI